MKRLLVALVSFLFLLAPASAASIGKSSGTYSHPYPAYVQPGDLVFGYSPQLAILPGFWTHVGIIAWYDPSIDDWIVIEAKPDGGVSLTTLKEFLSRYPTVAIERVKTDQDTKYLAIEFAYEQLGKPYNYDYLAEPKIFDDKYYCSELVWAAYMWASDGKINLDADPGWSWKYGFAVAPQEVYDSQWTYVIYYDSA